MRRAQFRNYSRHQRPFVPLRLSIVGGSSAFPIAGWLKLLPRPSSSIASRSSPLLLRLHPHATGRVVHHVYQPSGITATLGPRIARWPLSCSGRGVKTVRLLMRVKDGGLAGRRVLPLTIVHSIVVVQNAPIFSGGFGGLLSHIWSSLSREPKSQQALFFRASEWPFSLLLLSFVSLIKCQTKFKVTQRSRKWMTRHSLCVCAMTGSLSCCKTAFGFWHQSYSETLHLVQTLTELGVTEIPSFDRPAGWRRWAAPARAVETSGGRHVTHNPSQQRLWPRAHFQWRTAGIPGDFTAMQRSTHSVRNHASQCQC